VSRPTRVEILADLEQEHDALHALIRDLSPATWRLDTPSDGWTIADQVSHLAFFDHRAALALSDPEAFVADRERLLAEAPRDLSIELGRLVTPDELLGEWVTNRRRLVDAARTADEAARVPWYGPSMSVASFLTARLMETWAHAYDVADVLAVTPVPTARLRHVAHIGVSARPYSLMVNGKPADDRPVHVSLTAPDGRGWQWGAADADGGSVEGDALEFCLVVTQRRHLTDTSITVRGEAASAWMATAQAFAGPAGPGRSPRPA
jgi:uncharacterized protein (TIGR03084 family)